MYTVIGHPASRVIRVLFALEELGQPYDLIPATPRSDEVLALNPSGKIPVLKTEDGDVIGDSVAIVTYLADKHGALTHPAGTVARAHQDAVTNYIVAELDAALWLYAKHSFVLPEERRVPAVKETAKYEFSHAMDHLVGMLGEGPYMAGKIFTIPDILISHCAGWGMTRRFDLPGGAMGDYLKSVRKRPAMEWVMKIVQAQS